MRLQTWLIIGRSWTNQNSLSVIYATKRFCGKVVFCKVFCSCKLRNWQIFLWHFSMTWHASFSTSIFGVENFWTHHRICSFKWTSKESLSWLNKTSCDKTFTNEHFNMNWWECILKSWFYQEFFLKLSESVADNSR